MKNPPCCLLGGSHSNINWYQFTLSRRKPLWSNKQGLYTCVCICVTICVTLCAYIMSVCLMYTLMMCSSHAFPHVAGHVQNDAEDVVCESLRTALQCHIPYTIPLSSVQYFWLLMSLMFLLWVSYGYLFLGIFFFIDFHDRSLQEDPYHNRCPLATPLSFACCLCKPWMIALSTKYIKGVPHRKHLATAKRWEYIPQSFNAWYHSQRRHHLLTCFPKNLCQMLKSSQDLEDLLIYKLWELLSQKTSKASAKV